MTPTRDITTPEEMVAILGDVRRTRILQILTEQQASVKELSEMIGETPQVAHYHTKRLEAAGLIQIVETREVRGTLEKFYRAVADRFVMTKAVGAALGRSLVGGMQLATEWLQMGQQHLDPDSPKVGMVGVQMIESTREAVNAFRERLEALQPAYVACNQDGTGERYVLVLALFPFPKHIALPDDSPSFLHVAEGAEGVDLKLGDEAGASGTSAEE
jgi:DNA-binding transcriptional ArsR family regulator